MQPPGDKSNHKPISANGFRPADGQALERALQRAVCDAVLRHKHLGQSIVVWRDGRIVEIPADEIRVVDPTSS